MIEDRKEHGLIGIIKDGLSYVSQVIFASVSPQIEEGAQIIMKNVDDRMRLMEKRIMRKMSSLVIIGFGGVLLLLALFFLLTEFAGWSNAAACFSIGISVFVIGLLLKLGESNR